MLNRSQVRSTQRLFSSTRVRRLSFSAVSRASSTRKSPPPTSDSTLPSRPTIGWSLPGQFFTSTSNLYKPDLSLSVPDQIPYTEKTTPLLTRDEAQRYLFPLWRHGWEIVRGESSERGPVLVRKYTFKGPKSARSVVHKLLHAEEGENHHVSFELVSVRRPTLRVRTQTHSARLSEGTVGPGITLRDARMAAVLELFVLSNKLDIDMDAGKSVDALEVERKWKEVLRGYPWTV